MASVKKLSRSWTPSRKKSRWMRKYQWNLMISMLRCYFETKKRKDWRRAKLSIPRIDSKTAFHYPEEVKNFFENTDLDTQPLKGCMDQVFRISKKKQTIVTDYFSASFRVLLIVSS